MKKSLLILKEKCHWLRAVSWEICGQCKLCPGKIDRETGKCFRHQEQGCGHDDCAHYVPVKSSPFCCKDARGPDLRIGRTWIQVCFKISHRVFVNFVVPLLARFWKSRFIVIRLLCHPVLLLKQGKKAELELTLSKGMPRRSEVHEAQSCVKSHL